MTGPRWFRSSRCDSSACIEVAFTSAAWVKTRRSEGAGACVEVAHTDSAVGVRDSKNPDSPVLTFCPDTWTAFLSGVKAGEFDR